MGEYTVRIQIIKGALSEDGDVPSDAVVIEEDALTYSNLDNALAVYRAAQEPQKTAWDNDVHESSEKVAISP